MIFSHVVLDFQRDAEVKLHRLQLHIAVQYFFVIWVVKYRFHLVGQQVRVAVARVLFRGCQEGGGNQSVASFSGDNGQRADSAARYCETLGGGRHNGLRGEGGTMG